MAKLLVRIDESVLRADVLDLITRHAADGLTEQEYARLCEASAEEYGLRSFIDAVCLQNGDEEIV